LEEFARGKKMPTSHLMNKLQSPLGKPLKWIAGTVSDIKSEIRISKSETIPND
jgi:hypothetical protein